jgi:hypothetical protein
MTQEEPDTGQVIFVSSGDSGEAERYFRREAERHSGKPEHHRSVAALAIRLCKKCSRQGKPVRSAAEEEVWQDSDMVDPNL